MENLSRMNDRDEMEIYLNQFSKTELIEIAAKLNYQFPVSATKKRIKNYIVETYAFMALNRMMANREFKHPILGC